MPPKARIRKEDILAASVRVIQRRGPSALTVRHIAEELGCSTQPLYSHFASLEHLREELLPYIRTHYLSARCRSYKEFALWFLRFAEEEKNLFRFLYLRPRSPGDVPLDDVNCELTVELLSRSLEMDPSLAREMHRRMHYHCYGLGVMIATGYRSISQEELHRELSDFYSIILAHYKGLTREDELGYWLERSRNLIL